MSSKLSKPGDRKRNRGSNLISYPADLCTGFPPFSSNQYDSSHQTAGSPDGAQTTISDHCDGRNTHYREIHLLYRSRNPCVHRKLKTKTNKDTHTTEPRVVSCLPLVVCLDG